MFPEFLQLWEVPRLSSTALVLTTRKQTWCLVAPHLLSTALLRPTPESETRANLWSSLVQRRRGSEGKETVLEAQGILYLLQKKTKEMTTTPAILFHQNLTVRLLHTGMGIEQSAVAASAWPQNLKIWKTTSPCGSVNPV